MKAEKQVINTSFIFKPSRKRKEEGQDPSTYPTKLTISHWSMIQLGSMEPATELTTETPKKKI